MSGQPTLPCRIECTHPNAQKWLSEHISYAVNQFQPVQEIAVVCIGTDRSTGDSLGPLTGTFLERLKPKKTHIFGTLAHPVHAMNLSSTLERIEREHPKALTVAIDACLGQLKSVGWLHMGLGPIKPGAGVNKVLPEVGHAHITGIVNVSGFMEHAVLQSTRLSLVLQMAEVISSSIWTATRKLDTQPTPEGWLGRFRQATSG